MMEARLIDTPMGTNSKLDFDEPGPKVNETMY